MAIRHWSGRRLVGTWAAGIVAEGVLIALPIAFVVVTSWSDAPTAIELRGAREEMLRARAELTQTRVAELNARVAQIDQRMAALKAIEATESRADLKSSASIAVHAPLPIERVHASYGPGEMVATGIDVPVLYGIPLAATFALYLLAIPVGLVAITLVWFISRISGPRPPPSAA